MFHSSPVTVFVPHVVPPRPEHLLCLGVAHHAGHESGAQHRHLGGVLVTREMALEPGPGSGE